jgi:glycosyltransferase involved in cell wall biosynthesis
VPDWNPTIDVLMGTFNEERYLPRALEATQAQDYPRELVKIWIVDGGSTDGTLDIARRAAQSDPRIEIVEAPPGVRLNLPASLNAGLERGSAELVAKIDAHGWPEPDFLSRAVAAFVAAGAEAGCVGGRPEQLGDTDFGHAVGLARGSRFGVGGSDYAGTEQIGWVPTVQCGVYRRSSLDEAGPFDPEMNYGEDEELNWRLEQAGHRIWMDTRIRFHYVTRPSWKSAFRQYRNYGRARVAVVRKHPQFLRVHHLAPAAFVAGVGGLALLAPVSSPARRLFTATATAYASAAAAAAVMAAGIDDPARTARVASVFPALHAGYGIGLLEGLRGVRT